MTTMMPLLVSIMTPFHLTDQNSNVAVKRLGGKYIKANVIPSHASNYPSWFELFASVDFSLVALFGSGKVGKSGRIVLS